MKGEEDTDARAAVCLAELSPPPELAGHGGQRARRHNSANGTCSRARGSRGGAVAWPTQDHPACNESAALELAETVREQLLGPGALEPIRDLATVLRAARARLRIERLSAAMGELEALMLPAPDDRFEVVVDPEPCGGWQPRHEEMREDITRHRTRFRVAHELAHSFFYTRRRGRTPRRLLHDSPQQERFCDAFAAALLLPPQIVRETAPTGDNVFRVHTNYDVSVELAVRAFGSEHPERFFVLLYDAGEEAEPRLRVQWRTPGIHWPDRWWAAPDVQRLSGACQPRRLRSSALGCWLTATPSPRGGQVLLVGRRAGSS